MQYLTVKEVAEILGISGRRVRKKLVQTNRICFPGAKKVGHQWVIPLKEVEKEKILFYSK